MKRIASLSARQENNLIKQKWFVAIFIGLLVIEIIVYALFYNTMAMEIPYHWNLHFEATNFAKKSIWLLLFFPFIRFFLLIVFTAVNQFIVESKIELLPDAKTESLDRILAYRRELSIFLFNLFILLQVSLVFMDLFICLQMKIAGYVLIFLAFATFFYTIKAIFAIWAIDKGDAYKVKRATMNNYTWKHGWLYFNSEDASIIVEKRKGIGYTLNFARYQSWVIIALIILVIPLFIAFSYALLQ